MIETIMMGVNVVLGLVCLAVLAIVLGVVEIRVTTDHECPDCGGDLSEPTFRSETVGLDAGLLECSDCNSYYSIDGGADDD